MRFCAKVVVCAQTKNLPTAKLIFALRAVSMTIRFAQRVGFTGTQNWEEKGALTASGTDIPPPVGPAHP